MNVFKELINKNKEFFSYLVQQLTAHMKKSSSTTFSESAMIQKISGVNRRSYLVKAIKKIEKK
tara:strand:+ start:1344 stop:1532 length:189 start_codon:yes stop_codon:yes gene_type:complete